jgi:N-glycosylase/DNA lyase
MGLPMQDIIDRYYEDDELLVKALSKIVKSMYPDGTLGDYRKYITKKDYIQKISFSINLPLDLKEYEDIKAYELMFADYDKLETESVFDIINGYIKFMQKVRVPNHTIEQHKKAMAEILNLNENLTPEIQLWVQLQI